VKGGALVLAVWGLLLVLNAVLMATVFGENPTSVLLLGGAGAACMLVGAALWLWRGRAPGEDPDEARRVTDASMAAALAGAALALMLLGTQYGAWLVLIGAGLLALGLGGLVRELHAERRG
jgi:peptidoglycan/LPS O-acetylase OafA/YrhL